MFRWSSLAASLALTLAAPSALAAAQSTGSAASPGLVVNVDWLSARLDDPRIVVLHVSSRPDEYDRGHLSGARLLTLGSITWPGNPKYDVEIRPVPELEEALEAAGVSDDRHIVIYSSNPIPAARLWMTLDYLGHGDHASILDGGLRAWTAAGKPVVTDVPLARRGSFTPKPRTGMVVDAEWIRARLEDPGVVLVDARPDDEYTGADGGMGGMTHAGHIPGATQMYWESLIESQERPFFRDRAELRSLFEAAGAGSGRTVVAYCMVGLRASVTYFVARMLGYDAKFYDGSWHDWGTKDLPYERGEGRKVQ